MKALTFRPPAMRSTLHGIAPALALTFMAVPALAADDPDCPGGHRDCGQHNMMLVGADAAFLSHLPMFGNEHRFQVIAEVTFTAEGEDLGALYTDDRAAHPETRMYTVAPAENFVLSRLFTPDGEPERKGFAGNVFRGHLERGGQVIDGLRGISVEIEEIVYAQELAPEAAEVTGLHYVLFGQGDDLYLAHVIGGAPDDFDQIVDVSLAGSDAAPANGAVLSVPGRANLAADRLQPDQRVTGEVAETGEQVELVVGTEYYFEEGELLSNVTFAPTELEREAGFGN